MADMTQAEFAERMDERPVVLFPLGSQEVQGPQSQMGDFRLTERISELAAERSGALVAPALPFGYADFFRDFAGGIQLRPETFVAVLTDMLTSLLDHGLNRLLIVNGHTTNAPLIAQVARRIRRSERVLIPSVDLWQALPDALLEEIFEERNVRGHGGEPLTSIGLHLFPENFRADLHRRKSDRVIRLGMRVRSVSGADFEGMRVNFPVDAGEVDRNGLLGGSALHASATRGNAMTEYLVAKIAKLATHLKAADPCLPEGESPA
ncbi:creatininase family protein [uncultured Nitratireductor sp.]|uniref:creatininase family protein n=1 Tax=uncultured Nitratireductor sp. TaxID=520953 RepID=UPI0025FB3EC1|nr:creatininase family protein [uncultured Nitratireductor sp.]